MFQGYRVANLKIVSVSAGILALAFGLTGEAEGAGLKIGVVNIQRAVSETRDGKKEEARLKKLKKKLESTLNRKLKEFYAEEKKNRASWSILKDAERRKRADSSQKKMQLLQKEYMGAERELMQRKTRAMKNITVKLNRIIEKVAKKDKYDYIFANAAVLWAPRHVDLTNQVIRAYNRK